MSGPQVREVACDAGYADRMNRFIAEAIEAETGTFDPRVIALGEPSLPRSFSWRGERLVIAETLRTWRSTKTDRGDAYLDKHWFEVRLADGRLAVVAFHRRAKRGQPRWWLQSLRDPDLPPGT